MTELRKQILNNIYKREVEKAKPQIFLENQKIDNLEIKKDLLEEQLDTVLKYHIYSIDTQIIDDFKKLKEEYYSLSDDKRNYFCVNFLIFVIATMAYNFNLEGHYTLYLLDYFRRNKKFYDGYDVEKYKLVKKKIKNYLQTYNIEKQYYNLEEIVNSFNNDISYIVDDIRISNDIKNKIISMLKQTKLQLYGCKMIYIDGKLKLHFNNSSAQKCYNILKESGQLKPFPITNGKVRTLKKTITIK